MKIKKIASGVIAFALVLGGASIPAAQSGAELFDTAVTASAETYGDYEYTVLEDGTVEITGYTGSGTEIIIPSTINGKEVSIIVDSAFAWCESITSITIPDSVTIIDAWAFYNCTNLTKITVDSNNKYYSSKDGVLFNKNKTELIKYPECTTKTSYSIPNTVTSIGDFAFAYCESFTSITIPSSVTSIGVGTFSDCYNLKNITIPNSVTSIGNYAFGWCKSLTSITIPNSVTSIGDSSFESCTSLTSITIPNKVTSIGDFVFGLCENLTSITIPNSVTSIGDYAFGWCTSLTSITIPSSVTSIGKETFVCCDNLTIKCFSGSAAEQYAIDNDIPYEIITPKKLSDCTVTLGSTSLYYNGSALKPSVTVKNGTTTLTSGTDYTVAYSNNINAGTGKVTITGIGNYTGTVTKTFTINPRALGNCTTTLGATSVYFRGTRIRPTVTVTNGTTTLKQGTDYTVAYFDNLTVGTGRVVITGKGNYSGTVTKTFKIEQRSIGNCDIELAADSYYFNSTRIKPSVKVYCNGVEMYSGNYTVSYANNLSAGTATVTLTGMNNLKGTVTKTFTIKPRNIGNCTITLTKNSTNKYQPKVSVKIGDVELYSGNYAVSYKTSSDLKTVTVTLTGKNNLSGTVTKTYTVV